MSETAPTYHIAPAFAGQSFVHEDWNGPVTAETLTDEAAEFFIKAGRSDAFVKVGSQEAQDGTTEQPAGAPADHAQNLANEQQAHTATAAKLEKETELHGKATEALKSEKEAHKATKAELSEALKQVKDLQKLLDKAAKAAEGDAGKTAGDAK